MKLFLTLLFSQSLLIELYFSIANKFLKFKKS